MRSRSSRLSTLTGSDSFPCHQRKAPMDVWSGPTAPPGHEANWVQTLPGKGRNPMLRLYGPLDPWFDKTWRPGEVELVK